MTNQVIYTGDLVLKPLEDGEPFDIEFVNGQPLMTNFLETISIMYIFGRTWWGNNITKSNSEKMQSTFPEIIERNVISDSALKNGVQAIKSALQPMIDERIATEITVTGEIFSVYGMGWEIVIAPVKDAANPVKYQINWDNVKQSTLQWVA